MLTWTKTAKCCCHSDSMTGKRVSMLLLSCCRSLVMDSVNGFMSAGARQVLKCSWPSLQSRVIPCRKLQDTTPAGWSSLANINIASETANT